MYDDTHIESGASPVGAGGVAQAESLFKVGACTGGFIVLSIHSPVTTDWMKTTGFDEVNGEGVQVVVGESQLIDQLASTCQQ